MGAKTSVDVIILGGGSGGYACALRAADRGLQVLLIEAHKVGGTCLHSGCIPTKALLHAAEVADYAASGSTFGVNTTFTGVDEKALLAYQDRVVGRLYHGLSGLLTSRGVKVISGTGKLTSPTSVLVDGEHEYYAPHIVIATGSAPRGLEAAPVDGQRVVFSDAALRLPQLPATAIIVGGGVIGCEFASAWASLGVEVTIVEGSERLLPREEPDLVQVLHRQFTRRGIKVKTHSGVTSTVVGSPGVTVTLTDGSELKTDLVLVAVGRVPRTAAIGLDAAGIQLREGYIHTDGLGRTNVEGVYAVGDVVAGPALAHRGFAHGIMVADQIAGNPVRPVTDTAIPRVVYSNPELASVGLSEAQARQHHGELVRSYTLDLRGNGKSQLLDTEGRIKVVQGIDGLVLGIHLVGARVSELIGEAQLICGWEAHPEDVAGLIHAHPTQNEAIGEALMALAGQPLHAHK